MSKKSLISDLESISTLTLPYYELNDSDLNKSYGEGKWTIRQILHHLSDTETVLYDRIRRTISNPGQVVWGFDQDAWASRLDYENRSLKTAKDIFQSVRAAIVELAERHYEGSDKVTIIHSGDGKKSLQEVFDKVLWHNEGHLDQIKTALGR